MAKKREIFKVNEDALKDMMASESISCAKPETGSIENLPSREAENEVQEVEKREQKKLRKAVHTDPNMDERLDLYRTQFLERKKLSKSGRPISVTKSIKDWPVHFPFLMQI